MNNIQPEILARFNTMLKIRQVPLVSHSDYRKWLRYFLDFQAKYPQPGERSDQVRRFSEKLRSKGQTALQVRQAADALSVFFTMQKKRPADSSPVASGFVPPDVPKSVPQQSRGHDHVPVPIVKESGMVCEPPGLPDTDAHYRRRRGPFDDWRCLRKTPHPAWDKIIVSLADEIKARHYSRKTLQHYANWTRKFQSYLSHKDPDSLSPQDVKSYLTYLAVDCKVSSSTQNLAFNALLFLYRHILKRDFGNHKDIPRAKRSTYVPVVLSQRKSRKFS